MELYNSGITIALNTFMIRWIPVEPELRPAPALLTPTGPEGLSCDYATSGAFFSAVQR